MTKLWYQLFLEERPSIGLSFFRISVALTTGFHVIPCFFQLGENYYHTAFKTFNLNFFPFWFIELVQKSSNGLVLFFVFFFLVAWFFFLIGLWTQKSCILMVAACYYFYALNSFQIGTLSWDILLVTLFLMCLTPYPGDYFSIDCLRRGDPAAYQRKRPFFVQRLLQMQIAFTYFYTALYKITFRGNWLTDNPIYYLMNYPPMGVTKNFLLKEFFAARPQLCYWAGISIVVCELLLPFLLFCRRTRASAIVLGVFFHIVLILTFDVPAIFFFLFPVQLLLFIHPDEILKFIEQKRIASSNTPTNSFLYVDSSKFKEINIQKQNCRGTKGVQNVLLYDGNCQFCRNSVNQLRVMDLFNTLKMMDYNLVAEYDQSLPEGLTKEKAASQLHLIEPDGSLYGGYFVFRRLSWKLPMLYPLIPIFYFPGSGAVGPLIYRWVAKNRYLFHFNKVCKDNQCFVRH